VKPILGDYLKDILTHSETTSSVYVGFEDGTFRMVMRTTPGMLIQNQSVPADSTLAYRWIDRGNLSKDNQSVFDVFTFKNKQDLAIGATQVPATYDPRQRDWYRAASINKKVTITAPYIFSSSGLPGITIASPFFAEGKMIGVIATDITLDNLSKFLA
jgi:adenylate cyclase